MGSFYSARRMALVLMSETATRTKWKLTKEAFDKLLVCLDEDREAAGEKFLLIRRNLVRFFEGRGCFKAEEYADETINRAAKRLFEGEVIQDVNNYCFGAAKFVLLEGFKEQEKEKEFLNELPEEEAAKPSFDEEDEREARLECLNGCLQTLPQEGRDLITQYYKGERRDKIENRQRIADSLGIPLQALRSRAVRLRDKLEACLTGCFRKKGLAATRF